MIQSPRLYLHALSAQQLELYRQGHPDLQKELKLKKAIPLPPLKLQMAIEQDLLPLYNSRPKPEAGYGTLWIIIHKSSQQIAGSICVKDMPDADGTIEIGYGTEKAFRNMGLMHEALEGLLQWAGKQSKISSVMALTEQLNVASQKLLKAHHFKQKHNEGKYIHWQRQLKK